MKLYTKIISLYSPSGMSKKLLIGTDDHERSRVKTKHTLRVPRRDWADSCFSDSMASSVDELPIFSSMFLRVGAKVRAMIMKHR